MKKVRVLAVSAVIVVISAALIIFSVNSCVKPVGPKSGHAESGAQQEEKVRLRFISSWGGADSKSDTLQKVLNGFMENNPDILVINESMFGEDFLPKLKTDFASGNAPDVFGLWPGSDIRALIHAGKVADLTSLLNEDLEWKKSFGDSAWSYTTFDGRIYGLPLEIIFEGLFVNKDLFSRYGVGIPQTYEDLKEAVRTFKERGVIPIAYNSLAEGTFLYQNIISMIGDREDIENPVKDGKITQCYLDAINYIKELYQLGAFPEDAFTMNSNDRNSLFKNKKAAMIVQGSWFIGDFEENDKTVEIVPFPGIGGKKPYSSTIIYGLGCGTFYMSKNTWNDKNKRLQAEKLLRELTSRETATLFATKTGMLSNVDISSSKVQYSPMSLKGQQLLKNATELIGPPDSFVDRSAWEEYIVKKFPHVLEGRTTPEALWEEALSNSRG